MNPMSSSYSNDPHFLMACNFPSFKIYPANLMGFIGEFNKDGPGSNPREILSCSSK